MLTKQTMFIFSFFMWQSLRIIFLSCLSNEIQTKTSLQDFHQDLKVFFFMFFLFLTSVTVINEEIISEAFLYLSGVTSFSIFLHRLLSFFFFFLIFCNSSLYFGCFGRLLTFVHLFFFLFLFD